MKTIQALIDIEDDKFKLRMHDENVFFNVFEVIRVCDLE